MTGTRRTVYVSLQTLKDCYNPNFKALVTIGAEPEKQDKVKNHAEFPWTRSKTRLSPDIKVALRARRWQSGFEMEEEEEEGNVRTECRGSGREGG